MAINLSKKEVVIDDFIGGEKGLEMIKEMWKEANEISYDSIPLDIEIIRKSVAKQLGKKEYDLMIFVETGGIFFLGTPEIKSHAKTITTIPVSERRMVYPKFERRERHKVFMDQVQVIVKKWIQNAHEIIKTSNKIAIVEGDVGWGGFSYLRLSYIKKQLQIANPKANIEIIVGTIPAKLAERRLFDVVGVIVGHHKKLSDIAEDIENMITLHKINMENLPRSTPKLLRYWRARYPVPYKEK